MDIIWWQLILDEVVFGLLIIGGVAFVVHRAMIKVLVLVQQNLDQHRQKAVDMVTKRVGGDVGAQLEGVKEELTLLSYKESLQPGH